MTSIKVESGNTVYDSRDNCNAIIETATNTLLKGCDKTKIPNSITSIGEAAFSGCSGLTSISISKNVTSIGGHAFQDCSGLASITIPNNVTSIGYEAFSGCSGLASTTIPNSVTSIGKRAFSGCSGLTSIHCKRKTPLTSGASDDEYDDWYDYEYDDYSSEWFDNFTYQNATLYVPTGSYSAYKNTYPWSQFKKIVEE